MSRRLVPALVVAFHALLGAGLPARAADLSVLAGATVEVDEGDSSYAWQAAVRQSVLPNFAASLSWINEGHLPEHHRDGVAAQAWGQVPFWENRLSLGFGAGVYRYYDTRIMPGEGYENIHGWAPVYSVTATWYPDTRWFAQATINHIHPAGDFDSNTFLAGVGYRLGKGTRARTAGTATTGVAPAYTTGYELMPFAGQVVLNQPGHESGVGSGVEFRMGIDEHLDWTATLLSEDVSETFHRAGLATQVWVVDAYLDRRVTLGLGAGIYAFDADSDLRRVVVARRLDFASLVTVTASYRFADPWFARFEWDRVGTRDNLDSDIFLLGVGYRWNP